MKKYKGLLPKPSIFGTILKMKNSKPLGTGTYGSVFEL